MADNSHLETLKARLARGEITIGEYKEILGELTSGAKEEHSNGVGELGSLLAEVAEVAAFEHGFKIQDSRYRYDAIASIRGGVEKSSVNGITTTKKSHFSLRLSDGMELSVSEGSTWFGRKRHTAIVNVFVELNRRSFNSRVQALAQRLRKEGEVRLGYSGLRGKDPVTLFSDGTIGNSKHRFDIKAASAMGTLQLGVTRANLGASSYSSPLEIVISDKKKPRALAVPLGRKISFVPTSEDPDIVHALIGWIAAPENRL